MTRLATGAGRDRSGNCGRCQRQPFEPFRIKLVNGDGHDVLYPDLVALLEDGVYVASQDGHWAQFPYDRVASFESLLANFFAGSD